MFKLKVGKVNPSQLAQALKGELEIDVTPEIMRMIMQDEDAQRLNIATKATDPETDKRLGEMEATLKAFIESMPALIDTAVKAAFPAIDASMFEKIKGMDPSLTVTALNELRTQMVGLAEKATQAALTAESVKTELAQRVAAAPILGGQMTPQMAALLNASNQPQGPFARNAALNPPKA